MWVYKNNIQLSKYALNNNISILRQLLQTEEICKYALDLDFNALKYINPNNQTEEICKYAININPESLNLITNRIVKDKIIFEKNSIIIKEKNECIICYKEINKKIALIPCGHTTICKDCSQLQYDSNKKCPICRSEITQIVNIF